MNTNDAKATAIVFGVTFAVGAAATLATFAGKKAVETIVEKYQDKKRKDLAIELMSLPLN